MKRIMVEIRHLTSWMTYQFIQVRGIGGKIKKKEFLGDGWDLL